MGVQLSSTLDQLPATDDPTPRVAPVPLDLPRPTASAITPAAPVVAKDDFYSDRIRCDHPVGVEGERLAEALLSEAESRDRGRVMVMAGADVATGLERGGLDCEAVIPGFYRGAADCVVMGAWPDPERAELADPEAAELVRELVEEKPATPKPRPPVDTRLATPQDADAIAELLADTFPTYPTPSGDPEYVEAQLEEGTPFRLVEDDDDLVACASADLTPQARTAELTDCATRPSHRGNGYMQAILTDLMDDLRERDYPTAFTLARARVPGMNLAFHRLGFSLHGTMVRSCRIGDGIEDMNVWSTRL